MEPFSRAESVIARERQGQSPLKPACALGHSKAMSGSGAAAPDEAETGQRHADQRDRARFRYGEERLVAVGLQLEVRSGAAWTGEAVGSAQDGGQVAIKEAVRAKTLRRVDLRCRRCGAPRQLWFVIVAPLPS